MVASSQAQGFGNVVHTLVDRVVQGEFGEPAGVGVDTLMEHVAGVWGQIAFRTPWSSVKEYAEVRDALSRYLTWQSTNPRTHVASEQSFTVDVEVGGSTVRLNGFADRVELDSEGRVVVVDFKTSKNPPRTEDVRQNAQLGLYQLAAEAGAFREALGRDAEPGGAELVQLRKEVAGKVKVQEQAPQQPDESGRRTVEVPDRDGAAAGARRGLPGRRRHPLPLLRLRAALPDQDLGDGDVVSASPTDRRRRRPRRASTPREALQRFMRADYPLSAQQFAAVTAPLEPAVVIAGAGSGKTTLMAARVVWLVGTGRVRPEEILGLTFTTKAASELATRVRETLTAAGILPEPGGSRPRATTSPRCSSRPSRPTTPTPPPC